MPDTPSITLVKTFTYRDAPEQWSNTYHFTGDTPATDAEWKALALAIFATEKAIYTNDTKLETVYGYEAGNEVSVAQIDLTVGDPTLPPGTLEVTGGDNKMSGDQAAWARARTGVGSTGKKKYIRKYWHGGSVAGGDTDEVSDAMQAAMTAHTDIMLGGTLPGGATWCGPQGEEGIEPKVSRYVTTRTLRRRGKRPTSP